MCCSEANRRLCVDKKMAEILYVVSIKFEFFAAIKNFP